MHQCTSCPRTFKFRSSLTRHAHNHRHNGSNHVCTGCGVSFARRDLLNRHIQTGGVHAAASGCGRQRCHTACEGCRSARTKCDGALPCSCCRASGKACRYSEDRQRVSQRTRWRSPHASPEVNTENGQPAATALLSPSGTSQSVDFEDLNQGSATAFQEADEDPVAASVDFPEEFATLTSAHSGGIVDLDGMPWPWLHENLFLNVDFSAPALNQDPSGLGMGGVTSAPDRLTQELTVSRDGQNSRGAQLADGYPPERQSSHLDQSAALSADIDNLADLATQSGFENIDKAAQKHSWHDIASGLGERIAFDPGMVSRQSDRDSGEFLDDTVAVYLREFNPLWPLMSRDDHDLDNIHPILYLVMVSIGSMYGHATLKQFGSLLHKRLRRLLTASLFDLEGPEGDLIWLAQARLLTQVQGLYFGQQQGFSYAQQLGAILIAQSRRLNLFTERTPAAPSGSQTDENTISLWKRAESRKRLAFGIFRADIFTSVLLNTRPLLTFEEMDVSLPFSDDLWHNANQLSMSEWLIACRIEAHHHSRILFSDLMRILLDENEQLPELGPVGYELCLFGLQLPVWKFAHDPEIFERLTGSAWSCSAAAITGSYAAHLQQERQPDPCESFSGEQTQRTTDKEGPVPTVDFLGQVHRRMKDLITDRRRVDTALDSWHSSFQARRVSSNFVLHRATLMSSLLLWHASHLQLHAPLHQLHKISYSVAEGRPVNPDIISRALAWASTKDLARATKDALAICEMISQEQNRPPDMRAQFNFLAFGGLHHATVVLWASSKLGRSLRGCQETCFHVSEMERLLYHEATQVLLEQCAQLFKYLSPLGGASFEAAAKHLSNTSFPNET